MEVLVNGNVAPDIIQSAIEIHRKMNKGIPKFSFEEHEEENKQLFSLIGSKCHVIA